MAAISSKYKAVVYDKPGTLSTKIVELDTPVPGPGEVLVRLTHSGVCHSDLAIMLSALSAPAVPPTQVGGHEGVGVVQKLGPGVGESTVKLGERVGIKWVASACLTCAACLEGRESLCFVGKVSGCFSPGTFQQYVLAPANYITKIPDGLSSAEAAPMLCAGITTYAALQKSNAKAGQWVAISGAGGGLGHIACQIGSHGMAIRILALDSGEKEKLCLDSGAEAFIDITKHTDASLVSEIHQLTDGLGVKAALVCTSSTKAYNQALHYLRFGGTLVCVGLPRGDESIAGASPGRLIAKGLSITGVIVGNRADAEVVLDFARRGIIKAHYSTRKMEGLKGAFEDMRDGLLQGRVVLDLE